MVMFELSEIAEIHVGPFTLSVHVDIIDMLKFPYGRNCIFPPLTPLQLLKPSSTRTSGSILRIQDLNLNPDSVKMYFVCVRLFL